MGLLAGGRQLVRHLYLGSARIHSRVPTRPWGFDSSKPRYVLAVYRGSVPHQHSELERKLSEL